MALDEILRLRAQVKDSEAQLSQLRSATAASSALPIGGPADDDDGHATGIAQHIRLPPGATLTIGGISISASGVTTTASSGRSGGRGGSGLLALPPAPPPAAADRRGRTHEDTDEYERNSPAHDEYADTHAEDYQDDEYAARTPDADYG